MHVNRPLLGVCIIAPELVHTLAAGKGSAGAGHELIQNEKFLLGHVHAFALEVNGVGVKIQNGGAHS